MDNTAIKIKELTKDHGKNRGVFNVDLSIEKGSVFGLLGRNGAGKTTLIRSLLCLEPADFGTASIMGLDFIDDNREILTFTGYVDENKALYTWMSVRELMDFTAAFYETWDKEYVNDMLGEYKIDPSQKIGELSRGAKAEVALITALGHKPKLLVLDEPASGLDVIVRSEFLEKLINASCSGDTTVLISSHILEDVERICDHVAFMDQGKILFQTGMEKLRDEYAEFLLKRDPEKKSFNLKDIFVDVIRNGFSVSKEQKKTLKNHKEGEK
jgi:ABC-2 type transport system ATP-binding protein